MDSNELDEHGPWAVIWEPYSLHDGEREFPNRDAALDFIENRLPDLDPDASHVTLENETGKRHYEWDIER